MADNIIYQEWNDDVRITIKRKDPVSFLVVREAEDGIEQGLVMLYLGNSARERHLTVDQGHLTNDKIPAQAFTAMWRAITHGLGMDDL